MNVWLPWLHTSWRDSGYVSFTLVWKTIIAQGNLFQLLIISMCRLECMVQLVERGQSAWFSLLKEEICILYGNAWAY